MEKDELEQQLKKATTIIKVLVALVVLLALLAGYLWTVEQKRSQFGNTPFQILMASESWFEQGTIPV